MLGAPLFSVLATFYINAPPHHCGVFSAKLAPLRYCATFKGKNCPTEPYLKKILCLNFFSSANVPVLCLIVKPQPPILSSNLDISNFYAKFGAKMAWKRHEYISAIFFAPLPPRLYFLL